MEHGTQVRCRDCATGWVIVNSQEDVPSASHRLCEACIRKVHSQRTERRAQEPKPRGKPPNKNSNRGNNDGDELAAQPPPPPPLHDAGGALLSSDPTQPSVTHSTSPHTPTREEQKAMTTATSWQHNRQCHPPLYDSEGNPGDEPGDPLLHRDPTPAAVELWSRHLSFLRACLHDTPGGALSWHHHLSV